MPKQKRQKSKSGKPLMIAIHGDDLDIEATFRDNSQLNQSLIGLIVHLRDVMKSSKQTAPRAPIAELLSKFVGSLSVDQVTTLQASLTNEQKLMFIDIMSIVQPREETTGGTSAQAS